MCRGGTVVSGGGAVVRVVCRGGAVVWVVCRGGAVVCVVCRGGAVVSSLVMCVTPLKRSLALPQCQTMAVSLNSSVTAANTHSMFLSPPLLVCVFLYK